MQSAKNSVIYRGTLKTYSRPLKRVCSSSSSSSSSSADDNDVAIPIKRIRMDETGNVVEETVRGISTSNDRTAAREEEGIAIASSATALSSSPRRRDAALFSSDDAPQEEDDYSSPPSSPPPARLPSPIARGRKPAFAFLKRQRPGSSAANEPLAETTDNIGAAPTTEEAGSKKTRKRRMTQMQIDLGGEVRKACKTCGMDYIPSNMEDAGLHKKFHAMNEGGVSIRKVCLREMTKRKIVMDGGERGRLGSEGQAVVVVVVDGRSSGSVRCEAKRVLEVVNTELSAVGIEDKGLWGRTPLSSTLKRKSAGRRGNGNPAQMEGGDRFKVYLYLDGDTCVGLCLAEKIEHAYRVVDSCAHDEPSKKVASVLPRSSSISTSETAETALLGISRIWTSTSHRRKGVAAALLDAARRNFFYGMEVPKDKMAFSQPTESGGQLAEYWFDKPAAWLVYAEAK